MSRPAQVRLRVGRPIASTASWWYTEGMGTTTTTFSVEQGGCAWIETDLAVALARFDTIQQAFPAARWGRVELVIHHNPGRRASDS